MNKETLEKYISEGLITSRKHNELDLWILNYTPEVQYERLWDDVTLNCRGLIVDKDYNVVERSFPKFFNYGELDPSQIPDEKFRVYEKMDGSLGILYWHNHKPKIATRGSFHSDQAEKATRMLKKFKIPVDSFLSRRYTYLFEIIYPENRIVVDYGREEELILLGAIDKITQNFVHPIDLEDLTWFFKIPKEYSFSLKEMLSHNNENSEGYVIVFESGFRMKIKFEDYVKLHAVMTELSSRHIWEALRDGDFHKILEIIPDEMYDWVHKVHEEIMNDYKKVKDAATKEFEISV